MAKKPDGKQTPSNAIEAIAEFDQAMRKIVKISKTEIEQRERDHKLPPAK